MRRSLWPIVASAVFLIAMCSLLKRPDVWISNRWVLRQQATRKAMDPRTADVDSNAFRAAYRCAWIADFPHFETKLFLPHWRPSSSTTQVVRTALSRCRLPMCISNVTKSDHTTPRRCLPRRRRSRSPLFPRRIGPSAWWSYWCTSTRCRGGFGAPCAAGRHHPRR